MRNSTRRTHGQFPMRGDRTLRSVGGPPAAMTLDLATVKEVALNTLESVYPWMGFTVGAMFRRNPIIRIAAPVAGLVVGVVRAMTHTENSAIVAEVIQGPPIPETEADALRSDPLLNG